MPTFVFCHGFGFDKNFWKNLGPKFSEENCVYLELGYFSTTKSLTFKNAIPPLIGIGHSLGLIKLLTLDKKFDYLIGLNSFTNFLGKSSQLRERRKKELYFLTKHFIQSPMKSLKNFYERCGFSMMEQAIERMNVEFLLNDLKKLALNFAIPESIPTLIIGTDDDVVVPPEILHDNFYACPNVRLEFLNTGKHALGFSETCKVYRKIMDFINDVH